MVEANVAFSSVDKVKKFYEWFAQYGPSKPKGTTVQFILGNRKDEVKDQEALELMVDLIHGGGLSGKEIRGRINYAR